MANTQEIISLALSKLGIAGGAKGARQSDLDLGLTTLKSYYRRLIQGGGLGRSSVIVLNSASECYTAPENSRILRASEEVDDIQLPLTVLDPITYCWRAPKHGAFVVINDSFTGASMEFIYDSYINQWCSINDISLELDSIAPLSADANGLAARLAVSLADHYSMDIQPATLNDSRLFEGALVQANGEPEDNIPGYYF